MFYISFNIMQVILRHWRYEWKILYNEVQSKVWIFSHVVIQYKPPHDKINKVACAHREDSDQCEHPPSLISLRCPYEGSLQKVYIHYNSFIINFIFSCRQCFEIYIFTDNILVHILTIGKIINYLVTTLLMSTHNKCFYGKNKKSILHEYSLFLKLWQYILNPCPAEPGYTLLLQTM